MFEPAHGSAPKYKGQDKVDPVATVLAGAWMLEYLGQPKPGAAIFAATKKVIAEKKKLTYDLGGNAKSSEMADEIIRNL
jgi:isocitrate dehydrogenase